MSDTDDIERTADTRDDVLLFELPDLITPDSDS